MSVDPGGAALLRPTADGGADGNPIITSLHTCDPAVLLHDGVVHLYTGHDEAEEGQQDYVMHDWHGFTSTDLRTWQAHGPLLHVDAFAWAAGTAKAGSVVERDGRFFWYVAVDHATVAGGAVGVAVADSPLGPFVDARGEALITNDVPDVDGQDHTIDPSVIVHEGEARIFWGKHRCFTAALDPSMTALAGPVEELALPGFEEGALVHHRDGWFYLLYGFGVPQRVAYARSRALTGPWRFEGVVNEVAGNCETNRPAVLDLPSGSYFWYHNGALPGGGSHRRSVCLDRLTYDQDGRIEPVRMTSAGLGPPA